MKVKVWLALFPVIFVELNIEQFDIEEAT